MKTHQEFINQVKSVSPQLTILGNYNRALEKIEVKCNMCGYVWETRACNLSRGSKCPKCHCKSKEIPNAIIYTHPEIAKMMANEYDKRHNSYGSTKKVDWICPNCNEIVEGIAINKVVSRKHVPCKKCSDGISYPNKYMAAMLRQLNILFNAEYSPEWIRPKRYDFYLPDHKLIIEMDGAIGHGKKSFDGRSADELSYIDSYKDSKAQENGLKVIRIDCEISDSDYISRNIIRSDIKNYIDISYVDWNKCDYESYSSLKKQVIDLWNQYQDIPTIMRKIEIQRGTILKYLHCGNKYGWCNYDNKLQQIKSGKRNIVFAYTKNMIPVVCLTTNQKFDSIRQANRWAGLCDRSHSITDNCKNKLKTAGEHPVTKERLRWAFASDLEEVMV